MMPLLMHDQNAFASAFAEIREYTSLIWHTYIYMFLYDFNTRTEVDFIIICLIVYTRTHNMFNTKEQIGCCKFIDCKPSRFITDVTVCFFHLD